VTPVRARRREAEPAETADAGPAETGKAEAAKTGRAGPAETAHAGPAGTGAAGPAADTGPGLADRLAGRFDRAALDRIIRIAGLVIAIVAAILSGVLELFLTPLRVGGFLIGVAVPAAVVVNVAIAWFAVTTTGRRWALGPPWAIWTLMMLAAAGVRTTEGDYLLSGDNWVALVMILVGSLTFAVCAYRMILGGPSVTKP
jgi:hypothetical protein